MCDLQPGDIVECIDDKALLLQTKVMPVQGQIYGVDRVAPAGDGYSVRLRELTPSCHLGGPCACGGCGWDSGRFRKVYRPDPELITRFSQPQPATA